jgi:serine protease Do
MMVRSIRTPLLCSFTAVLASGAPLHAQRAEAGGMRRAPRAEAADTNERQLRRLERRADSLAQLYNEGEELSAAQRRAVGEELDRTMAQVDALARRMAAPDPRMVRMRVQVQPMIDERNATAMSEALRQAQASQQAVPRGWMGVNISGTARESRIDDNGELIIHYMTYPIILSVDPSSPAQRAGLAPGDTLMAYDGRDVRDRDISITQLVRPNARVLVRIRRGGKTKNVPVTIADVPSRIRLLSEANFVLRTPHADGGLPETMAFPQGPVPVTALAPRAPGVPPKGMIPSIPGFAAASPMLPMSSMAAMPPMPPMPQMPPMPPQAPTPTMIFSFGLNGVAGAQLAALTDGLARTVGVRRGVLVTYVGVGSPAYMSSLRDGDVIVRVAGKPVRTVAELREQVQLAVDDGESRVDLDCVREKKPLKLVLRWNDGR